MRILLLSLLCAFLFASCDLYQSQDRFDFENDYKSRKLKLSSNQNLNLDHLLNEYNCENHEFNSAAIDLAPHLTHQSISSDLIYEIDYFDMEGICQKQF